MIPPLQAQGYEVIAAQYGLDTNESDVAMVKRSLAHVKGPTILVGHSYVRTVSTHLLEISRQRSRKSSGQRNPRRLPNLFGRNAPGVAWKTKPSWYIVAKNDQNVPPDLERFLAKRINAQMTEADSSHVVMLSKPGLVVDVVVKAASDAKQTSLV